ncbi:CHASE2 domain-containing protein [Horticoccus sp. 23ND18S-11]|uniref:CHASE2 domain-containing protein n=1 Tax=Horticoccus sp. 23ND18S-11 TaxID=3391832 RepID=UPI0039C95B22
MSKLSRAKFDWRYLLLLPIPFLWALLGQFQFLSGLENNLLDLRFRLRGEIEAPVKLIYVDLDTRALQELGERPWSREKFGLAAAALIEKGGARAVGFDFVFSGLSYSEIVDKKKASDGNIAFARVIRKHPNIILAVQYTEGQAVTQADQTVRRLPLLRRNMTDRSKNDVPEMPQYPLVTPTWGRVGLIDFDTEYGGDVVPRWVPMFAHTVNPTLYHMSLQLVLQALGLDEQAVKIYGDRLEIVHKDGRVALTVPLREGQLVEVNWFSRWGHPDLNPRVSLADVLGYERKLTSEKAEERAAAEEYFAWFRGAIVLIGPTDTLLQDLAPSGMESTPVPKVGVHGNMVKTILSGKFLTHVSPWVTWVNVFLLTALVTALAMKGGARGLWYKLSAVALVALYCGLCVRLFKDGHLVLPMAAPLGAALSTSFAGVIWRLLLEEKQKGRIKGMFGTYVSPQLVDKMIDSGEAPQLGGHEEEITAYFSDIQSFSSFSEKLPPAKLVELMNEYLTACTDIVQEQGGTLDKYIGDAVVAMFGAPIALPDHAYRACVATQLVHQKLGELRAKWKAEGDKWPEIVWKMQSRIGLNSGMATIGNMGSRTRFNYTMMGDNVNLAARMESGAKRWGAYTMATEATKRACEQHGDRVVFRALGKIQVMGRQQAVPIFEIVGLKESLPPTALECIAVFERGLERYYARDWDGAVALFQQSATLEPNQPGRTPGVKTNPSLAFIEVVEERRTDPPAPDWDGRYVMTEK